MITDVIRLEEPVPCRGAQSVWKVDDEVRNAVDKQLLKYVRLRDIEKYDLNNDGSDDSSADETPATFCE